MHFSAHWNTLPWKALPVSGELQAHLVRTYTENLFTLCHWQSHQQFDYFCPADTKHVLRYGLHGRTLKRGGKVVENWLNVTAMREENRPVCCLVWHIWNRRIRRTGRWLELLGDFVSPGIKGKHSLDSSHTYAYAWHTWSDTISNCRFGVSELGSFREECKK